MPDATGRAASTDKPTPPPEAPLIRLVRLGAELTADQAARRAGISKARWSQIENGYERRQGAWYAVRATDGLLARMARAIGLGADRLDQAGRGDAAEILREMAAREGRTEEPPVDLAPQCEYEREALATPGLDDAAKRLIVRAHRLRGHTAQCAPDNPARAAGAALPAAVTS